MCMLLSIFCLFLFCPAVSAQSSPAFAFVLEGENLQAGDSFTVGLHLNRTHLPSEISGFRVVMHYDPEMVTFKKAEGSDTMQGGAFRYYDAGGTITAVYAADGGPVPVLEGLCAEFRFSIRETADAGYGAVEAGIDQIVSGNMEMLEDQAVSRTLDFSVVPPPQARLESLLPSVGTLEPAFDPEITLYDLKVDSSVSSVTFNATAAENGTVSVNRKNLLKAGETTEFIITVKSSDGKLRTRYMVRVHRAASEEDAAQSGTSSKTVSSRKPTATGGEDTDWKGNGTGGAGATEGGVAVGGERKLILAANQYPAYAAGVLSVLLIGLLGYELHRARNKEKR